MEMPMFILIKQQPFIIEVIKPIWKLETLQGESHERI